ncbi:hypothetical protein [Jiella avicenniae]|uniref:Uncharacterized protein n=1 Tax=Jiella avicenniae TaxID=2907202 RepID=A0A9X1P724_9HYPH|nr:hypothetical protein [Jiella avicenniae]MCE7030944.1 hypothetical protein [Jiella avicenniae]
MSAMADEEQNWLRQARQARESLPTDVPHGSRLEALTKLAGQSGTSRAALRNALAALTIVEQASKRDAAAGRALATLPVSLVEAYGRWVRHDGQGAADALAKAASGTLSVRGFVAAERSARPSPKFRPLLDTLFETLGEAEGLGGLQWPNAGIKEGIRRMGLPPFPYRVLEIQRDLSGYDVACGLTATAFVDRTKLREVRPLDPYDLGELETHLDLAQMGGAREDETAEAIEARPPIVAAMEVSERPVIERYRLEAKNRFFRAAAAAAIYPLVLVVLPDEAAKRATLDHWPALPYDRLGIKAPPAEPSSEHELRQDEPPPVVYPGRGQGAVVVTCPATALRDLCAGGADLERDIARRRAGR